MREKFSRESAALVIDDEGDAVEFAGRLTKSEYSRWFTKESAFKDGNHGNISPAGLSSLQDTHIDREFERLSQSGFILDNFFNIPALFRKFAADFAFANCSAAVIESFVHLASKLPDTDNDFEPGSGVDIMYSLPSRFGGSGIQVQETFSDAVYGLLKLYGSPENSNCTRMIVSILCRLYGTEHVVDIIHWWSSAGAVPGSVTDLVIVVENWRSEYKELPSHWIANVVSVSSYESTGL